MGCNYTLSLPKDRMPEGYKAPSTPSTLTPMELSLPWLLFTCLMCVPVADFGGLIKPSHTSVLF